MRYSKIAGFTLIELLVVIAIIGVLASIVIAKIRQSSTRAEDTKRIQIARQISKSLELFYSDQNHYPNLSLDEDGNVAAGTGYSSWNNFATQLSPYINTRILNVVTNLNYYYYMSAVTTTCYTAGISKYVRMSSTQDYYLSVYLADPTIQQKFGNSDGGVEANRFEILGGGARVINPPCI